jgi:two-component system sensor kinase FixL
MPRTEPSRRREAGPPEEERQGGARSDATSERFALLLEGLPDAALCMLDRDGRIVSTHGALLPDGTLQGRTLADLYTVEDADAGRPAFDLERAALQDAVVAQAFRVAADGRHFWARSVLSAQRDDAGAVRGYALVLRDMSDHGRAEQALQESESRYRAVSEMTSDYAYAIRIEPDGRVVMEWMTGAFTRITGYSREEMEQREPSGGGYSLVHADDRLIALARVQRLLAGLEDTSEFRIVTKSGEVRWIRESGRPEVDQTGTLRVYGAARDVTEIKLAEEQARSREAELAHVLRLGTMGEMAAGLAHEINQPLSAIVSYARGCTRRLRSGAADAATLAEPIEEIAKQAMRANEIVQRLLLFVRKQKPARARAAIGDLVQEVGHLLAGEARKRGVKLRMDLASDLPEVEVDRIQIEQVILNLVRNGLEATPPGLTEPTLTIRTELDDGCVAVAVTDQGEGLQAEQVDRVFEPFFTTKRTGLGMGLAISRSIVRGHGGRIEAPPNAGRGATFRFTLPIAAPEVAS